MDSNHDCSCSSISSREPWTTRTFSQSGASTSFLSASTRSKPLPHETTSLPAGFTLMTLSTSLPEPLERLSFTGVRNSPSTMKSLPAWPNKLSELLPPRTRSLPGPPTKFLSPTEESRRVPPHKASLPSPPSRLSLPRRAMRESLPPLPTRLSAPLVPLRVSGPLVPILVTASATPLATNRVRAMVATSSMVRLIKRPPLFRGAKEERCQTAVPLRNESIISLCAGDVCALWHKNIPGHKWSPELRRIPLLRGWVNKLVLRPKYQS